MNKKEFKRQISMGYGNVIIFLKNNPKLAPKYFNIILWACCHDTSYDSQAEPKRTQYLYEIVCLSGKRLELEQACINHLFTKENKNKIDWDINQRLLLLIHFYNNGNSKAKEIIYNNFNLYLEKLIRNKRHNITFDFLLRTCVECIITIDGLKGLEYVVNKIGEQMLEHHIEYIDTELESARSILGNQTVDDFLLKQSINNQNINKFYTVRQKEIKDLEINIKNREKIKTDYQSIIDTVNEVLINPKINKWGRFVYYSKYTDYDVLYRIAELIENTTKEDKLELLLRLFRFSVYPLKIDYLLKLTKSKNKSLISTVLYVLSNIKDERIHDLAIDLFKNRQYSVETISLLINNFDNDYERILSLLKREYKLINKKTKYDFHSLVYKVLEIIKNNKSPLFKDILIFIYYRNECSNCRLKIIKHMLELNILPDKIKEEIQYDCNTEIRELLLY